LDAQKGPCNNGENPGIGMLKRTIPLRTFGLVVAGELLVILGGFWIASGAPGLRRHEGPPSITIDFAPAPAPVSPVRAYKI
jgi:hypothetical protein